MAVKHHVYLFGAMAMEDSMLESNKPCLPQFQYDKLLICPPCCVVLTDGIGSELHIPVIQKSVVCQWVLVEVQNLEFLGKNVMSFTVYNKLSAKSCLIDG